MQVKSKNKQEEIFNSRVDYKKIIKPYSRQWRWFVLSWITFILLTFFYLRYSTPKYNAYAKIKLTDDETMAGPAGMLLKDLNNASGASKTAIEDEIEVLKSRQIMKGVVKKLDLNIQLFAKGRFHDTQFFPNERAPFKISFIESDSIINSSNFSFDILPTTETKFDFIYTPKFEKTEITKEMQFGKNVTTPIGDVVITPMSDNIESLKGQRIHVNIISVDKIAEYYKKKILISPAAELSKVLNLSLDDTSISRAKAILNTLVNEYNRSSIEDKNAKAASAAEFIDNRIDLISTDLAQVDDEIERFKTGNKLTDITSEAELYLNTNAANEQDLAENRTELNMARYMKNLVIDNSFERIPSNVGLSDGSINAMAAKYNELLDERDRLLKSSNEKNPIIVNLDQRINNIKESLRQSLNNSVETIELKIRSLENQSAKLSSKIYSVPSQVRKSRDIQREQGIKESLYLYLLEKREEATISLSTTSASAKIIDEAHSTGIQVSPKVMIAYVAATLFGLGLPFAIIYLLGLFNNKISNKEDLEGVIKNIPVLGEIPKIEGNDKRLIEQNDRSILSESFRIIRTNFDYLRRRNRSEHYDNVVFVTSTINGEGKSFISLNIALTIANTGKKVLLLGADVRNPQIYPAINKKEKAPQKAGFTDYLVDNSIAVENTINKYDVNGIGIDILLSGKVPPNPAELLMNDRVKELFDKVSADYDFVVVDTAPSMLVTDTLLISEYAGHTIYVTRADVTEKKILNFAKELHIENKLNQMMMVVNDVKQSNFGYGAKYGYYGKPEKKGFFKRMFSKK